MKRHIKYIVVHSTATFDPKVSQYYGDFPQALGSYTLSADFAAEQAKFEADILEIAARQEFWRAESDLRAADTSLGPESPGLLRDVVNPVIPQAK